MEPLLVSILAVLATESSFLKVCRKSNTRASSFPRARPESPQPRPPPVAARAPGRGWDLVQSGADLAGDAVRRRCRGVLNGLGSSGQQAGLGSTVAGGVPQAAALAIPIVRPDSIHQTLGPPEPSGVAGGL